eukprot:jgi/Tetstr1/442514/TSEL_030612.t1
MAGIHADGEDELELNYEENDSTMEVDDDTGAHRGAAEVPCMADVALDSPQRSLSKRSHSAKGIPDGTPQRLVEVRHLTTDTTELLELSSPAIMTPALAVEISRLAAESHCLPRHPQQG